MGTPGAGQRWVDVAGFDIREVSPWESPHVPAKSQQG